MCEKSFHTYYDLKKFYLKLVEMSILGCLELKKGFLRNVCLVYVWECVCIQHWLVNGREGVFEKVKNHHPFPTHTIDKKLQKRSVVCIQNWSKYLDNIWVSSSNGFSRVPLQV